MNAYLEVRSQHSRGSSVKKFGGLDTYVMVQLVPAGQKKLVCLNEKAAKKRGIMLIYCGQGYSSRCATERSMLGSALSKGKRIVEAINE